MKTFFPLRALFLFLLFVLAACSTTNRQHEISAISDPVSTRFDRIIIPATINGHSVRFILDTGANSAFLVADCTQRLGLSLRPPANPENRWMRGFTEECSLVLNGVKDRVSFPVIELPPIAARSFPADGLLGWLCYRNSIFSIDAVHLKVTAYDRLPEEVKKWPRYPLVRHAQKFIFRVPLPGGRYGDIFVDTGDPDGVGLYPEYWQKWKEEHSHQQLGLMHSYLPYLNTGLVIRESAWAEKISLGPLELANVPVVETTSIANREYLKPLRLATLGMAALKRMEVFVDGRHGFVYLRPR